MNKIVYKITNKVDGKVYIGQTNNLKRRIQEHKHDKRDEHILYKVIREYGFENFKVEVLYEGPDFNKKEEEYIKLYKSYDPDFGYNILPGRINSCGELNPAAKISNKTADDIINDLLTTELSLKDIASKYNTTFDTVYNLNTGISYKKDSLSYPLRKTTRYITKSKIDDIISDLECKVLSINEICEKYQIQKYTLQDINLGKTYHKDEITYPIRKYYLTTEDVDKIINMLRNTNMSIKDIASEVGTTNYKVYDINSGNTWRRDNISYPIRHINNRHA